ncbi:putative ESCRT-II complex component [Talaromyces proteolyticus]|uniref:Vacuolar protein-sorting-associated protein 25 n=1 Tax=Talaromyces proteolyticus TaxID=1131652 RepID=A0AAD4KR78_9EURO|nr:putative ESCRT-II complex component [Talaromyces proteolyticus]KAH8697496.1 putative ESCRT-II complex component [Talaromyces proteolyticus]
MPSSSPPNSFLSAPTTAGNVLTPASPISSRDPSIRTSIKTATTTSIDTISTNNTPTNETSSSSSTRPPTKTPSGFTFPIDYNFPPFFTLQPNAQTQQAQMKRWADLISDWCRYHGTFRLSLVDAVDLPLFHNARLKKKVGLLEARRIVDWMAKAQEDGGGGGRAEWVPAAPGGGGSGSSRSSVGEKTVAWIWWRRPEDWAIMIADWIDETAQKNTVLTVYELINGDATISQEFHDMDPEVMLKALNILVKRGKAQIFGGDDEKGVKFF